MKFLRTLCLAALAFAFIVPPLALQASDLSITTASFAPSASAQKQIGTAGATITIGQLVYLDVSSLTWKLADGNVLAASYPTGIAATAAISGQFIVVVTADEDLTLGATLSMTAPIYILSANAGMIAPVADLTTGWYPSVVLIAKSTTKCIFRPTVFRGITAAS